MENVLKLIKNNKFMEKFTEIVSIAAPLPLINIDTDMIIPKQFLKTTKRSGLGKNLFHEMRYDFDGNEITDFILNKTSYRNAKIIIAKDNFGCGSSREHAPWSLLDFGIKVIIAPSFADIFFNNCFKNGILPIILDTNIVDEMLEIASEDNNSMRVDLASQKIFFANKIYYFNIEESNKNKLLNGLDEIGETLQFNDKINNFEINNKANLPWLW